MDEVEKHIKSIDDCRIPIMFIGKFYKVATRPEMLYGTECQVIKKQHVRKMRILIWMS